MSCPTCDHTVQHIGTERGDSVFWCPRCGTVTTVFGATEPHEISVPKLVERCRMMRRSAEMSKLGVLPWYDAAAHQIGVSEAIGLPDDRPVLDRAPDQEK